ncbi:MAG: FtsH protease activity modulator HflK [Candidatus Omnitrophica bacterium]|jgi:membrane protease subunit HflK|nr:FtsH protease activity modulator HflK [Candidatus Omnitrophota bacterium]MDD5691335.1 FtsH protease activity modulator HflK [Candidatus Omnitrophota bacterium]
MDWKEGVPNPNDIIDAGKKKFGDFLKFLPLVIVGFFILAGLRGVIYSIGPDEVGVIQRFGKYIALSSPGLHAKIPFGIDKVMPIKVEKVFKEEFGFKTIEPGRRTTYSARKYEDESLMLTGDLNILDVRWIVQFKIKDPVKLLFATRHPEDNIHDISEVVMRRFVGDYSVDEVLTTKREEIDDLAQQEIQRILDNYNVGVHIVTVKLLDVNPPEAVKSAFNEVNEAKQEKEKMINQAWEAYNKVIPKAKGTAEKTIRESEGYAMDKINRARGESARFLATLEEYKKAPDITKKRLYLETLTQVFPNAKEKYIIDSQQKSILPLLDINKKGGQQ